MIYWFTGQPGAGKSALAERLANHLRRQRRNGVVHLDGQAIRDLTQNNDFSELGRRRNVTLVQKVAALMAEQNLEVVVSMVSPFRDQREAFKRSRLDVVEFYVHTTEQRGKERYHCAYEPPTERFIGIDTTGKTIADSAEEVWQAVMAMSVVI